ncbi:MAG TPA: hypothetical protein VF240_10005 [Pyrinomonadaceae bacterium]
MKSYVLLTTLLALCFAAPECRRHGAGTPSHPSPEQAAQARRAIVNYFECEECEAGEIEAVVKLGQVAVPTLAATLLEGPSQANLELLRRHLTASYRELREYERTHPKAKVPGSEEQFVKTYMDNYVVLYQTRAATALGAIGGPEARRALEEASRKPLRGDVQAAVKASLEKIK